MGNYLLCLWKLLEWVLLYKELQLKHFILLLAMSFVLVDKTCMCVQHADSFIHLLSTLLLLVEVEATTITTVRESLRCSTSNC
jgi:multisubunit Na+/H+ antiporter MnhE subunit